jgi:hypothetical protein
LFLNFIITTISRITISHLKFSTYQCTIQEFCITSNCPNSRITATSSHFNLALAQKIFGSLQIMSLKKHIRCISLLSESNQRVSVMKHRSSGRRVFSYKQLPELLPHISSGPSLSSLPRVRRKERGPPRCYSLFGWLVADVWCWFVLIEEYCWLIASGWFAVRENYCWLVANKPSEQAASS